MSSASLYFLSLFLDLLLLANNSSISSWTEIAMLIFCHSLLLPDFSLSSCLNLLLLKRDTNKRHTLLCLVNRVFFREREQEDDTRPHSVSDLKWVTWDVNESLMSVVSGEEKRQDWEAEKWIQSWANDTPWVAIERKREGGDIESFKVKKRETREEVLDDFTPGLYYYCQELGWEMIAKLQQDRKERERNKKREINPRRYPRGKWKKDCWNETVVLNYLLFFIFWSSVVVVSQNLLYHTYPVSCSISLLNCPQKRTYLVRGCRCRNFCCYRRHHRHPVFCSLLYLSVSLLSFHLILCLFFQQKVYLSFWTTSVETTVVQ